MSAPDHHRSPRIPPCGGASPGSADVDAAPVLATQERSDRPPDEDPGEAVSEPGAERRANRPRMSREGVSHMFFF